MSCGFESGSVRRYRSLGPVSGPVCLFVLSILCLPPTANAQQSSLPLLVEIEASSNVNRTGGYVPLSLRFDWSGPGSVLNGDLMINLHDGQDQMGTFVLNDLYLSAGEQQIELLIPSPAARDFWQPQCDVDLTFITDQGIRHRLQPQILRFPGANRRSLVLAVGTLATDYERIPEQNLISWFEFERFDPAQGSRTRPLEQGLITLPRIMRPDEFPTHPLSHCVEDVVLLPGDVYAKLSAQQRQALQSWVRAGGSLCVLLADDASLSADHVEQLNSWVGAHDEPLLYRMTDGRVRFVHGATGPMRRHYGLGRILFADVSEEIPVDQRFTTPEWREAIAFLWKFRKEQQERIKHLPWSWQIGRDLASQHLAGGFGSGSMSLNRMAQDVTPQPTGGGPALLEGTLPMGMTVVPLWLIWIILVCYVLAIGPGDYILLGKLRARKFTWLLFPVVTISFTAAAIVLSNRLMGGTSSGGSVLFRDLAEGGVIARENRIELLFFPGNRTTTTELNGALFSEIDHHKMGAVLLDRFQRPRSDGVRRRPGILTGRLPTQGTVTQSVSQWTPRFNRTFRIPLLEMKDQSGFNWDLPLDPRDEASQARFRDQLIATFGAHVQAHFVPATRNAGQPIVLIGQPSFMSSVYVNQQGRRFDSTRDDGIDFILAATMRQEPGFFSLVSQVSPKCDEYLEDVPVLDPSDDDAWVLIVCVRDANNWVVYRKLYRGS